MLSLSLNGNIFAAIQELGDLSFREHIPIHTESFKNTLAKHDKNYNLNIYQVSFIVKTQRSIIKE